MKMPHSERGTLITKSNKQNQRKKKNTVGGKEAAQNIPERDGIYFFHVPGAPAAVAAVDGLPAVGM